MNAYANEKKRTMDENRIDIDVDKAVEYLSDNYDLDGTSMRLCTGILQYWNTGRVDDAVSVYLTDLLYPIGFDESDVDRMSKKGILK